MRECSENRQSGRLGDPFSYWRSARCRERSLGFGPNSDLGEAELDTVVLARDLWARRHAFGGLISPPNCALLLTTESSSAFWRHTLHHELFYLFDRGRFDDAAWDALNPSGLRYDPVHGGVRDPGVGFGIDPGLHGFISRYSMSSAREDRAELFAWLVTDHASVIRVTAHDSPLAAKVQQLKDDVAGLASEIDDRFWSTE
jgi:hypothetical protein